MKTLGFLCIIGLLCVTTSIGYTEYLPLRSDVQTEAPQYQVLKNDDSQVVFEVIIPGIERLEGVLEGKTWDRIHIPGGYYGNELGAPEVPFLSRMIMLPATAGARAELEVLEVQTLSGIDLMPAQDDEPENVIQKGQPVRFNMAAYSQDALFPEVVADHGEPAILRGVRMVPVKMYPVRYNPVTQELQIAHRFRVTVHFEGTDLRNVPQRAMRPVSRDYARMLDDMVLNLDLEDMELIPLGSYLIICKNDVGLLNDLLPLIEWKQRKGHSVTIETFTSASTTTIKNIIQNAYDTWPIPPEYVLLWGDTDGTYAIPGYESYGIDHPYTQLDGSDILADVAIGRFPAGSNSESVVMRNKILFYEKTPFVASANWYKAGVLVAGSSSSGLSTILANRFIKTRMIEREYTRIDTFWYNMGSGSVVSTLTNGINAGALYVNYRGWLGMQGFSTSNIAGLTNNFMLPFVTILTCGTGGFAGYSNMEAFSVVGSALVPTGAISCVGTATSSTHTKYLNSIDYGIYYCVYDLNVPRPGLALVYGKWELYQGYHATDPTQLTNFSKWAALAGDPGTELFTQAIQTMDCTIPATISWGENSLTLTVQESGVGPLEDAVVCFYKVGEVQEVAFTDASGQVTLPINLSSPGNLKVTITHQNFYPIVDSVDVVQADVAVGYLDHIIDDDNNGSSSGDDDGYVNPAETIEIPLIFKNYGSSVIATGVNVTASTTSPYVTFGDNYETFPNLAPGGSTTSNDDLDLTVDPACPHGQKVVIDFATSADQGSWDGQMEFEVVSYDLKLLSATATGGDTLLTQGETANFVLTVRNTGSRPASSVTAEITSLSPVVTVNDNTASFGTINPGSIANCSGNPFNLTASMDAAPGELADLQVVYTDNYGIMQIETITISLGLKTVNDPQGPDPYGYYCFDNTDADYAQCHAYDWVEIDPDLGGSGTVLPLSDLYEEDDDSMNRTLPFIFRYYGEDVDEITICTNGWISTRPNDALTNFRNWPIPSGIGPNGLIAAFYDDLLTTSGGQVIDWYDSANHRYIVEWSGMRAFHSQSTIETFQIILFDPAYYPTPTGDGEILFQYNNITDVQGNVGTYGGDNGYSTIGIESPDKSIGIEVVYWNIYDDPAAAHLQSHRTYFFTTDFFYGQPPGDLTVDLTYVSGSPVPAGGGDLYFEVFVENVGTTTTNFDAWIDISYQGGPPTTVVQRTLVGFGPGWVISRPNAYFPVPGSYAGGSYDLYGRVGNYPDEIWAEDSFPFTKLGSTESGEWQPFVPDGVPDPFEVVTPKGSDQVLPTEFEVLGAYPNPFNPTTNIRFALPDADKVSLHVFDISGRLVATLVNGYRDAGIHDVAFNAENLSSGIYFYRLNAGKLSVSGKMVLVK